MMALSLLQAQLLLCFWSTKLRRQKLKPNREITTTVTTLTTGNETENMLQIGKVCTTVHAHFDGI